MISIVVFLAITLVLLMAVYTRKLFETESNAQGITFVVLVSLMGTAEVLWLIPAVVRYFLT
jgi:hypothetical protein